MSTTAIIGLVIGLIFFGVCVAKGVNNYICLWITIGIIALTNGMDLYEAFVTRFIGGISGYYAGNFFTFIMITLIGKLCTESGAAERIGIWLTKLCGKRFAILGVCLFTGILGYFGVSATLGLFTIMPIVLIIMRENDIPRRFGVVLMYAACFGPFFVAPGSPAVCATSMSANSMGVSLTDGFVISIFGCVLMFLLQYWYIKSAIKKANAKGEHFEAMEGDFAASVGVNNRISLFEAFLPLIGLVILVNLKDVVGWRNEFGYFLALCFSVLVYGRHIGASKTLKALGDGLPVAFNLCLLLGSMTGLGAVITNSTAFLSIKDALLNLGGNPIISAAVSINVIALMCASCVSALLIVVPILGPEYIAMGASPVVISRVFAFGALCMDTMPYAGGYLTVMSGWRESHKTSYIPVVIANLVIPLIVLIPVCILFALFPTLP